ncbi:MAG: hypothetical protein JWM41_3591 [Gemmatimonadetes bacterium]|nr:hypothetical protein [Gemmatimonadota bacterium]
MINRRKFAALLAAVMAMRAEAQSVPRADSLLQIGALASAESLYYAAARVRPRDPIARWALGRYLVARGASRVGATLFEESLRFGGEPAIVGRDLVPVYLAIGEYAPLAALTAATPAERARAKWLVAHATRVHAPDSALAAVFRPATDSGSIGSIPIRINGRAVDATVSARVQGIVVSDTTLIARGLHTFDGGVPRAARITVLAAADSVGIGRLGMSNYPVTVAHLDGAQRAMIGLDMLGRLAPTFDPKANRVTLHIGGAAPSSAAANHFLTLSAGSDLRIMQGGGWISVTRPQIARFLRERRWTFDGKRGELIVEP